MQKYFYTAKQINELRTAAQYYKLDAPRYFWVKTAMELKKVCNGCGPERWSMTKREAVTAAFKPYEACFAIHDVRFHYGYGTVKLANKELIKNLRKVWRKRFGIWRWVSPASWIERFRVIPFIYATVTAGGERAWQEAQESRGGTDDH